MVTEEAVMTEEMARKPDVSRASRLHSNITHDGKLFTICRARMVGG